MSAGRQQPVAVAVPPGRDVVAVPALAPLLLLYGNVLLPRLARPRLPLERAVVALREGVVSADCTACWSELVQRTSRCCQKSSRACSSSSALAASFTQASGHTLVSGGQTHHYAALLEQTHSRAPSGGP